MQKIRSWLSAGIAAVVLITILLQPIAPVVAAWQESETSSPISDIVLPAPLPLALEAASPPNQAIAAGNESPVVKGQLYFAPAVDNDGDPATNPLAGVGVPVIGLLEEPHGMVILAAQVVPEDAKLPLVNVPVTFRLWNVAGDVFTKTELSDVWGAVAVNFSVRDLTSGYAYQAYAPGYGETVVRRFAFDTTLVNHKMFQDEAHLSYQQDVSGGLTFTVQTSFALDPERDTVTLLGVRQGISETTLTTDVQLAALELPVLEMAIVAPYTATLRAQLPLGDYRFKAVVIRDADLISYYMTQVLSFTLADEAILSEAASWVTLPIWISPEEIAPNQHLVQYDAPSGAVCFALVSSEDTDRLQLTLPANTRFTQTRRTGPFSWEESTYEIELQTFANSGNKNITLASFEYDPIVRRYTIAVELLETHSVTDVLRVDVLGPGNVVLKHETVPVTLYPDRLFYYTIEVPADLGQPQGLHVTLDNPLDVFLNAVLETSRSIPMGARGLLIFKVSVLYFTLLDLRHEQPPGDVWKYELVGSDFDLLKYLLDVEYEVIFKQRLALGTAKFGISFGAWSETSYDGPCLTEEQKNEIARSLSLYAMKMSYLFRSLEKVINKNFIDNPYGLQIPPFPITPKIPILMWWAQASPKISGSFKSEGLVLKSSLDFGMEVKGEVGFAFDIDLLKYMQLFLSIIHISDSAAYLIHAMKLSAPKHLCEPPPPPEPLKPPFPDDRQDVWQSVAGFYATQSLDSTRNNLQQWLEIAEVQGLERAATYLTLHLRQIEMDQFSQDYEALTVYASQLEGLATDANTEWQGIISGTIPLSPSTTITQAQVVFLENFYATTAALEYPQQQGRLSTALAIAERDYQLLAGEELELQHELRLLFSRNAVGVLASGFPGGPLAALRDNGIPVQLVSPWPTGSDFQGFPAPYYAPELAPRVLVVPSGGLHILKHSSGVRAWLAAYVESGGTLLVFAQQHAADWEVLPGGLVRGPGYEDAPRWQRISSLPLAESERLLWARNATPRLQIDGFFTAWPTDAELLAIIAGERGTGAGYPVFLEYPYGAGRVIATASYADWAWMSNLLGWDDDFNMLRSVLLQLYIESLGQTVADLPYTDLGDPLHFTLALTNTSALTLTQVVAQLDPSIPTSAITISLNLAPGAGITLPVTLDTSAFAQGTDWGTRVAGLYRIRLILKPEGGRRYSQYGPIVYIKNSYAFTPLALRLDSNATQAQLFQSAVVTATIINRTMFTRTVQLSGYNDLPATTHTLHVPPYGRAVHTYTLFMDSSKLASLKATISGYDDLHASLALRLTQPNLELFAQLPPALSDGAPLTVTVYNAAFVPWELGGTVRLTLTAPSGIVLWGETLPVTPLAAGAEFSTTMLLGLPDITEWGLYRLETHIDNHAGLTRLTSLLLPRTLVYALTTTPQPVRVGTPVTLTLTGRNTGWFDLHPGIEMYVPSVGLSGFLSQTLPVGAAFTLPLTFTLPGDFDAGSYLVDVFADDGDVWHQQLLFTVPPARLAPALAAGPYLAGQPLLFTLYNTGGVTGTAATTFKLWDERGRLALGSSLLITVPAGSSVSVPITLPLGLRSGDYRFTTYGEELRTHKSFNLQCPVPLSGSQGTLALHTSQDIYTSYDTVVAQGMITATEGALQGWLALEITEALPMHKRLNQQLAYPPNTSEQRAPVAATTLDGQVFMAWVHQGAGAASVRVAQQTAAKEWGPVTVIAEGEQPAITVDTLGSVYLVWSEVTWDGYRRIHFAQRDSRPPLDDEAWHYPAPIVSTAVDPQEMPAIAVDLSGNVYVVWQEDRGGATGYDIYFAYRLAGETVWSVPELVNHGQTVGAQIAPTLAVSRDGIVYAAWQTDDSNVYFAHRQPDGSWSAAEQIYAEFDYESQSAPALAVDTDGVVHLVWLDFDAANYKPVVYYARRLPVGVWTAAQPIDIGADWGEQSHPVIAVDAQRTVYVSWRDIGVMNDTPDVAFAYRHASLGVWQASFGISENAAYADQTRPALSVNPQGGAFLAWQQSEFDEGDYQSDLVYNEWAFERGWNANWRLLQFEAGGVSGDPDIVVGPDGTAYAVWQEMRSGQNGVYFAYSGPNQWRWSEAEKVNGASGAAFGAASLAVDVDGQVYVVWANYQTDLYFRSRSPQGVWGIEHKVNDDPGDTMQAGARIVVDNAGNVHLLWTDARNGFGRSDVFAAFRSATGVWDINRKINDASGQCYSAQLALDGAGNAYALWQDTRNANDNGDIYFAYRPVGGGWGANELVNDDALEWTIQYDPVLAVDALGNAYAAWIDERDQEEFDYLYMAQRPPEGTWGANVRIDDPEKERDPSSPVLAVDNAGNLALAWIEKRDGGDDALNGVYLAYRPLNADWQWLGALNEHTASHTDLDIAFGVVGNLYAAFEANFFSISRLYAANINFQPIEQVLWTRFVPVSTATTLPISQTSRRLSSGHYTLVGKLLSEAMQPLAEARYPFNVVPNDYSVTLDIVRADLTAGAPITVSGWITNLLDVPVTIPLTVSVGYRTLLTHTFALDEYAGAPYVTTFTTTGTALVSVETPQGKFVERVMVMGASEITATLHVPAFANDAPFIATLAVTNTGDSSAALQIFWENTQPITHSVAGGEAIWLTHTFHITHSAMLTAALRGDVTQDLTHWVTFGTAAALQLQEITPSTPDVLAVTYTVTNTGALEEPFLLEYRLNAAPFTRYILPLSVGQSLSNTLLFDIVSGVHTVDVRVLTANEFEVAAATLTVARVARESLMRPQLTLLSAVLRLTGGLLKLNKKPLNNTPSLTGIRSGQTAEMVVTLENAGLSLPAILEVSLFGIEQQYIITPTAGMVSTHTVLLSIPDDLPAGEYFGEVIVGAQRLAVVATLAGRSAAMQLDLDRTAYYPGQPLALTVTLTETAGISSTYVLQAFYLREVQVVTLTLPANQTVQYTFNYTATESARINIFLGDPIDPIAGQQLLMLDSLPINVKDPADGFAMTFDRLIYHPGDTISITLIITDAFHGVGLFGPDEWFLASPAPLWWMAPYTHTPSFQVQPGTYVLTTTVPAILAQGQYPFTLQTSSDTRLYSVDIVGWRILSRRIVLDKPRYDIEDALTATIEFWNQGEETLHDLQVEAWVYPPDNAMPVALTLPTTATLDLTPGLNYIVITGTFASPVAGPHRFLVNLTPQGQLYRIANAVAQFDVGYAHIVALTADHGTYAIDQVGTAVLDVYGFGPTHIVISATTGSILLDQTINLSGFNRYTVSVPTADVGDQLLMATVRDLAGTVDSRFQPYNVLDGKDTQPPILILSSPEDHVELLTTEDTLLVVVVGTVSDDSGMVTTLVNGKLVTPTVSGDFSTTVILEQGHNLIYAVAYDAAGNTTFTPSRSVYVMPPRGVILTADQSTVIVGEKVRFTALLTTTGILSNVLVTTALPYPLFEFPVVAISNGITNTSQLFQPFWYSFYWIGNNMHITQPLTLTLEATARAVGVFTQTITVNWGSGLSTTSNSIPVTILDSNLVLLAVNKIGPGVINSDPPGITCGITCTTKFAHGTVVTLTAVADTGYTFTGWSAPCNGQDDCVIIMSSDHAITATFSRYQLYLPVVLRQ